MNTGFSYAISDIHGCLNTFRFLVEEKIGLTRSDKLYLLGDYIDRGPDSKGVLDYIMQLIETGYRIYPLMGNHEDLLLKSTRDSSDLKQWLNNDGLATLQSFKTVSTFSIPQKYITFIQSLKYFFVVNHSFVMVHAGFNFSVLRPFEDFDSMLWMRNFILNKALTGEMKIIHGHTPIPVEKIIETVENPASLVITIDAGCVYKERPGLGNLIALNLDKWELTIVPNMEYN